MESSAFYSPLRPQLCQGDIFEAAPHVYLKELPLRITKTTLPGKKIGFEAVDASAAQQSPSSLVPAMCDFARGILLTFDCEIDKPGVKYLTIALARPLHPLHTEQQDVIRQNRAFAYFHLPASEAESAEYYVDFRRLATISPAILQASRRLAALSETAWQGLLFQYIRFVSRYEVDAVVLKRPV